MRIRWRIHSPDYERKPVASRALPASWRLSPTSERSVSDDRLPTASSQTVCPLPEPNHG
jgi:hypothetical protein